MIPSPDSPGLCSSAEDRQILVDHTVAHALDDKIAVTTLGMRSLKGYDKPVHVYLVGVRSEASEKSRITKETTANN